LTVSNITDEPSRERYTAKLDKIADEARQAVADATTDDEKADLLAKFLFKGPLHGGFEDGQVNFRKLLDRGKFNCVSSTVLYDVISHRMGLKTRAVTIPSHVFLR